MSEQARELYAHLFKYPPDEEACEAGDDKDYAVISQNLDDAYQRGRVAGIESEYLQGWNVGWRNNPARTHRGGVSGSTILLILTIWFIRSFGE